MQPQWVLWCNMVGKQGQTDSRVLSPRAGVSRHPAVAMPSSLMGQGCGEPSGFLCNVGILQIRISNLRGFSTTGMFLKTTGVCVAGQVSA